MRLASYATAIAAAVVATAVGTAATSSNEIPPSTAGHTAVTLTGATMKSVAYTVVAGRITAFTVQLKGPQIELGLPLFSTVVARFGSAADSPCVIGLYDAVADQTPVTCTGFAQPADRSWTLTITVS